MPTALCSVAKALSSSGSRTAPQLLQIRVIDSHAVGLRGTKADYPFMIVEGQVRHKQPVADHDVIPPPS